LLESLFLLAQRAYDLLRMIVRMEWPWLEGTDDIENADVIAKTGDTSRVEVDVAR
jgi:hypothetical protein